MLSERKKLKVTRWPIIRALLVVALLAVLFVQSASAGPGDAPASRPAADSAASPWSGPWFQGPEPQGSNTECMVDRFNNLIGGKKRSLGCTSNDVRLANLYLDTEKTTVTRCVLGDPVEVYVYGDFVATASIRWDVGVFVSTDGGTPNALGGACYNDYLNRAATAEETVVLDGGPYYNGELTGGAYDPNDTCGDIEQGKDATGYFGPLTIVCQDEDADGTADVNACTVWNNSGGTSPTCTSELQTSANTTSKCTCDRLDIVGLQTTGTLTLVKTVKNDNGGTKLVKDFPLCIDDDSDPAGCTPATSGTAYELEAGTYYASETQQTGYTASAWGGDCASNGSVTLAAGDQKTCTITNDDQAATLKVKKVVNNDNGGTKVCTDFAFKVDGGSAVPFEADCENDVTVNAGSHSVVEDAVPITGYQTTYDNCTDVSIANGGSATCTITNNDKKAQPTGTTAMCWVLKDTLNMSGIRTGSQCVTGATVTFQLFTNDTCTAQVNGNETVALGTVNAGQASATTANGFSVCTSGTYYWKAIYSGNECNESYTTTCGSEVTTLP